MAALEENHGRFPSELFEGGNGQQGGVCSFMPVPYPIQYRQARLRAPLTYPVMVAGGRVACQGPCGNGPVDQSPRGFAHFFTVTMVPRFTPETTSNVSINLRTPGSPSPRLREVEKPSRSAW